MKGFKSAITICFAGLLGATCFALTALLVPIYERLLEFISRGVEFELGSLWIFVQLAFLGIVLFILGHAFKNVNDRAKVIIHSWFD